MQCVKLLGQRRMARHVDRQVAEIQDRIAVLNATPRSASRPRGCGIRLSEEGPNAPIIWFMQQGQTDRQPNDFADIGSPNYLWQVECSRLLICIVFYIFLQRRRPAVYRAQ